MAAATAPARAAAGALTAAEEEAVIKARFLTQASVARGEPPFKRLAKRFITLCEEAERGSQDTVDKALDAFLRELSGVELQAEKLTAVELSNSREQQNYVAARQELLAQIEQAKLDIEAKKAELEQARIIRQHNEEYEVLRHLLVQHPPRAATQKEIDRVNRAIEKITAEGKKIAAIMQKRRQQFALLFHVIEELQRATDEPDEQPDAVAAAAAAAEDAAAAGAGGPQGMEVDG